METIWNCRRIPPPLQPDIVSVPHDFRVMGPVHSNFLDDGYWMRSNDYQAGWLGVQACLGPSSHHRREKPIPDKPRLIISRVMKCYFLCRTFTILEKLFPNQSFLPLCVCSSPPPVLHFPWITGLTPEKRFDLGVCVHKMGGRQLEKCNLPALQELELPIQTSLHNSCNQIVFFFSFPDNATNIISPCGGVFTILRSH